MKIIERKRGNIIFEHSSLRYRTTQDVINQYNHGLYTIDELITNSFPVSIPWGEFINLVHFTPQQIEEELHRHGIHTVEDMAKNNQGARAAINKALRLSPGGLLKAAKKRKPK